MSTWRSGPPINHAPAGNLMIVGTSHEYFLSDGTSWTAGAGYAPQFYAALDHVEVLGDSVRYVLHSPADSVVFYREDGDASAHATDGTLLATDPLVLVAAIGSFSAVMQGGLRIRDNAPRSIGAPRFNYFSAGLGRVVPFTTTYVSTIPWTADSFDSSFTYTLSGVVDFAHPLSPDGLLGLEIRGPLVVGAPSSTPYTALAHYYGNVWIDVTSQVAWSVTSTPGVTLSGSTVTVGTKSDFTLQAEMDELDQVLVATRAVRALANSAAVNASEWPMYQADAARSGYRPVALVPEQFHPVWTRNVGVVELGNVVAAEGKAFCISRNVDAPGYTLLTLDRGTGSVVWSHEFGFIYSCNPPAYAAGAVYLQTVGQDDLGWLWGFDAASGAVQFQSRQYSQGGVYLAPTIFDRKVYSAGGTFGGAYDLDAYTGDGVWFNDRLPQIDRWAPAVDSGFVYVFLNPDISRLFAIDRATGLLAYSITDASPVLVDYPGDPMPVLGSHHEILAVSRGKLRSFDLITRTLDWTLQRSFSGQISVSHDVIYAIDGGRLVALDEGTHSDLWSWQPPSDALSGAVISTDTHVLVASTSRTYAIDLMTQSAAWSYPAGGKLALGDEMLYILTPGGTLHAIRLTDTSTATGLLRFEGTAEPGGIRLLWEWDHPGLYESVQVERGGDLSGLWIPVRGTPAKSGDAYSILDSEVTLGKSYEYRLSALGIDGSQTLFGPIRVAASTDAGPLSLAMPFPNPAHDAVRVSWVMPKPGRARLRLIDLQGRQVGNWADDMRESGPASSIVRIPGSLPEGLYFVRLEVDGAAITRPLTICR